MDEKLARLDDPATIARREHVKAIVQTWEAIAESRKQGKSPIPEHSSERPAPNSVTQGSADVPL